jgi:response regulator RpfG family c-di-GMP phosphodiesterase
VSTILHQFAESLGFAIDAKDPHTSMHSDEVAQVGHTLALTMGMTPREADIVHVAGHLHDIGKIGVPDAVLQKQGPLNSAEWKAVRKHPEAGAAILRPVLEL